MSTPPRRPESVLVVIHTTALDILLLERVSPSGFWQSVTGSLEWGESAAAAAAREVREETGLPIETLRDGHTSHSFEILPQWRSRYAADVDSNLEHVWYLPLPRVVPVTLNPEEHVRGEWLAADVAVERVSSWTNRDAIAALTTRPA